MSEITFTQQDQLDFAAQSRDFNPMHVDPVAARRLLSGRQVVHGIHTLMHALERFEPARPVRRLGVSCEFAQTVSVGDPVGFVQTDQADGRSSIVASVRGLACTQVLIDPDAEPVPTQAAPADAVPRRIGEIAAPLDEPAGSQLAAPIDLEPWDDTLATAFPRAATLLGHEGLTALARLSYFVGMVCPGLHSVFSSLKFTRAEQPTRELRFRVRRWDPRFRLFIVSFQGALEGELRAFLRPPPQLQPSAGEVATRVADASFAGQRALVIGGSRGLGEITAKILAAGGARTIVSYAAGRDDAQRVAAEINGLGRGPCETLALDMGAPFTGVPGVDPASLTDVYYFATPRIYAKRNEVFNQQAFEAFTAFYLSRFHELCLWLDAAGDAGPVRVYLPSTVFITERPKGMTEYAMAKAAAEVLADDLDRSLRRVRIVHTRLPRLATDQTASIMNVQVASNLDVMLDVVRQMSSAISSL